MCGVCPVKTDTNKPRSKKNLAAFFSFISSTMPRILFVSGFHPATRARDLAYEFERYLCSLSSFFWDTSQLTPVSGSALTHTHARMFSFQFRAPSSSAPFDLASSPNESSTSLGCRSYAFVEFRSTRDAEDAYYDMYASVSPLSHFLSTPDSRFLFLY